MSPLPEKVTMPTDSITLAFTALLEVPALTEQLRRNLELAAAAATPTPTTPLPSGVRSDIGRITALLALSPSLTEILKFANEVDLRDLNEDELAYIEDVSLRTVRRWRTDGTGPEYRCESGISYPIRYVWDWRERGRQRLTGQKTTRGSRQR
ncbi:MAG TPA: hypothetical protein DD490_06675 [Acidobacteria bacterium]|nr:hypothetical protein [Acidobacteriota bacterium]